MLITLRRRGGHLDVFFGKDPMPANGWQRVLSWSLGGRSKVFTFLGWCIGWQHVSRKR